MTFGPRTWPRGASARRASSIAAPGGGIDPDTFARYRHLTDVLRRWVTGPGRCPSSSARSTPWTADLVLVGTPLDLERVLKIDKPSMRVRYELDERAKRLLGENRAGPVLRRKEGAAMFRQATQRTC